MKLSNLFIIFEAFKFKNMKSRFLLLLICLPVFMAVRVNAQSAAVITPDSRLYDVFDSSYISNMQLTNPALLAYYNFYLDNSYYTSSLTQPKIVTGDDITKVTVKENIAKKKIVYFSEKTYTAKSFNVLKYDFKTQDTNFTTYLWNNANVAIVFLPRDKISAAFQQYCKDNNIQSKYRSLKTFSR